jgi:hypothetical protein
MRRKLATLERCSPTFHRDLLLGQTAFEELLEALGLLDRVEVGALEVLDERQLEHHVVADPFADDRGDHRKADGLRGAPPAFAGDQLIAPRRGADDDGLQDAVRADARLELGERLGSENAAWLEGVRSDLSEGKLGLRFLGGARRTRATPDLCPDASPWWFSFRPPCSTWNQRASRAVRGIYSKSPQHVDGPPSATTIGCVPNIRTGLERVGRPKYTR